MGNIDVHWDLTLYFTPLHSHMPCVHLYLCLGGPTMCPILTWVIWVLWQISMSILWDSTLCSLHIHHSQWGPWRSTLEVPCVSNAAHQSPLSLCDPGRGTCTSVLCCQLFTEYLWESCTASPKIPNTTLPSQGLQKKQNQKMFICRKGQIYFKGMFHVIFGTS